MMPNPRGTTTSTDAGLTGQSRDQRLGVVVIGMHRSGTSAVTRAVNLLGVPTCSRVDLLPATASNARGHWESRSLVALNNDILRRLGRSSVCPPPLDAWANGVNVPGVPLQHARRVLHAVHPTSQWVWKDPRTCLTLPLWLRALRDIPLVFILALRHPHEIAASLRRRDGLPELLSLCLWERYLRHALTALAGRPVFVTHYDHLLTDPAHWASGASEFLAAHGTRIIANPAPADALHAFLHPRLRHERLPEDSNGLSQGQRILYAALRQREGSAERFQPPVLPAESHEVEIQIQANEHGHPDHR